MTCRRGLSVMCTALFLIAPATGFHAAAQAQTGERPLLRVKPAEDFEVTGTGDNKAWQQAEWTALNRRQADGHPYDARFKMLYSKTGLYFLMEGTDSKLTATMTEDFMDLWNEDVFEVFLWTDERYPVYLEYEISPLNHELPILIPNFGGQFLGWRPWHFEGDRATRKATNAIGGSRTPHAAIKGWQAEFFIPYALLKPLQNVPPKAGTRWRANFYRVDYDDGKTTQWDWTRVGQSFHEFEKFGDVLFTDR
jgi:hypothetical protein